MASGIIEKHYTIRSFIFGKSTFTDATGKERPRIGVHFMSSGLDDDGDVEMEITRTAIIAAPRPALSQSNSRNQLGKVQQSPCENSPCKNGPF